MNQNIFRAFGERNFLFLWLSEICTQISVNLLNFLLILLAFSLTKSNTFVAAIIISFTLPAILFGIVAGVYVDHWNKKKVLLTTTLLRAGLIVILALFHTNIFVILCVSFLIALVTQFFIPAETPMIPLVVPESLLYSANALFGLGIFGSILIAYVLSGPLLLYLGDIKTIFLLAILLLIGAIFISLIKLTQKNVIQEIKEEEIEALNVKKEIKSAFSLMLRTKEIYNSIFLIALSQVLMLIIAAVTPGFATQVLGLTIEQFPVIFITPAALGLVVGAIILVNFFQHYPKEKLVTIGVFLAGLGLLMLPYGSRLASKEIVHTVNSLIPTVLQISNIHILIVLALILGIANALVFVPSNTLLQEKTTDEFRGKIYGVLNAFVGIFSLFPIIIVGGLSDLIGVGRVITGIGISLIMLGIMRVVIV